ncbi:MAG: tetratricopeptide repeat protein [Bacteroidota bacterium]
MSEERIRKLKAFLEKDPNDSFSNYALALEYAGMSNQEKAIALLEKLARRDPSYIPTYQQLGYLYQKANRRDDAIAIFKSGIEKASQQGDTHARSEMQDALDEMDG